MEHDRNTRLAAALVAGGAIILAIAPVRWLVRTWHHPAFGSHGAWVFVAVAALFAWSASSPRLAAPRTASRRAAAVLGLTALLRLAGQVLAINVASAATLAVDVYALALLAGLGERRRAVSPGWLAVLFAFSLPVERIAQRTVGYLLQQGSAAAAATLLRAAYGEVEQFGIRLVVGGHDVLVDLPCSGARGLLLVLLALAFLAALDRPSPVRAATGVIVALISAFIANALRIALLAAGLADPALFAGRDVMASPWHDAIGLLTLAVALAPVIAWSRWGEGRGPEPTAGAVVAASSTVPALRPTALAAAAFAASAVVIAVLPGRPIDVSTTTPIETPLYLDGRFSAERPLSSTERDYFMRYGGAAAKADYGEHALLVARTSAPLRHLHAPDECLAGAGYRVESLGLELARLPSAVYRATDPDGDQFRVRATYVSDRGHIATSIAEAVWIWLCDPAVTWTSIQRSSPWETPHELHDQFDRAVAAALDIPFAPPIP